MTPPLQHRTIAANGIHMHVVEQGAGPLVLLCHGFPETWYSWRHQIAPLARAGFRVVAPDLRGFGRTDAPQATAAYGIFHLVGDLVDLVVKLGEEQAIIVGHDWGATLAWHAALLRPDMFRAVASLGIPFRQRGSQAPIKAFLSAGLETFYWVYFQTPGVAEAEFERNVPSTLRRLYYAASGDAPAEHRLKLVMAPGSGFLDGVPEPEPMPAWLTDADLATISKEFSRTGFGPGLNWYRNVDANWQQTEPWHGAKVLVPALFICGTEEPVIQSAIGKSALVDLPRTVPNLVEQIFLEGAGHWVQEERPTAVTDALISFLERCKR
jgi:pimeloyl-ACP methyl ester carboxylesterase